MIFILQLVALILLLVLSAFFSSSEIAYFSLSPIQTRRISESNPTAGKRVQWILSDRTRLLSTILVGNTLVNVAIPALIYSVTGTLFGNFAGAAAIPISLLLLLVFGEIGPKRFAVTYPEKTATLYSGFLKLLISALAPFRWGLQTATQQLDRFFHHKGDHLSDEEFESVVELSREEGLLDEEERAMLKGIFRMETLKASDVMTPRVDLIGIDLNAPPADILALVKQVRVRKVLIFRDQLDNVEGFLDVRRFMLDPNHSMENARLAPIFVPESCPLDKLLAKLLQEKRRSAIVVDEYGGTAGIVTRGDILEEIVGELDDEKGAHAALFQEISPGRWMLDGRVNLELLGETLNLEFEDEGVGRIAGWINAQLERIPHPGDSVLYEGHLFSVRQTRKNSASLIEVTLAEEPES